MRKLRLNLEELEVESFETDETRAARGTVLANEEYSWGCPTDDTGCRTPGYASCEPTRCDECSTPPSNATCGVGTCGFTVCCM